MAIGKPILYNIYDFDATKNYTINFKYDVEKPYGSLVEACDNDDDEADYKKVSTYKTIENKHVINSNVFKNGKDYRIRLKTLDNTYSEQSNFSNVMLIRCRTTPTFKIQYASTLVSKSYFKAMIAYSQKEGMLLKSYRFYLYYNGNLIETSPELYRLTTDNISSEDECSYTFKMLTNNSKYKLVVKGVTEYGRELSATYQFTVKYTNLNTGNTVALNNTSIVGDINVFSKVNLYDAKVYDTYNNEVAPEFSKNNLVLSNGNHFDISGLILADDFTIEFSVSNFDYKNEIPILSISSIDSNEYIYIIPKKCITEFKYIESEESEGDMIYNGKYFKNIPIYNLNISAYIYSPNTDEYKLIPGCTISEDSETIFSDISSGKAIENIRFKRENGKYLLTSTLKSTT